MSRYLYLLGCLGLLMTGCCKKQQENNVVSERYIHKYGYAVSKDEFTERKYPGQVVTVLKNGVTMTSTYENGVLHGSCTHTFPHSQVVETYFLYNQGNLVKQIIYEISGMPLREEVQLSPTRYASTKWYTDGTPMCTEEYASKELVEAQYFTRQNEVEARVEKGRGNRVIRDLQGVLLTREDVDQGFVTRRESFFASGAPESIALYSHGLLNGERQSFSESGEPLAVKEYVNGKLHGKTTFFKNGARFVEAHYLDGKKNGLEIHYFDGDKISQEILWENDKKHGPSKYYVDGIAQVEYFYDGRTVSENKWKELNQFDEMIGQISPDVAW
ncbi:MAG: toxin-antitoxin system YwqK family antitoxin [Thermodesulfobacteriota bacterium]